MAGLGSVWPLTAQRDARGAMSIGGVDLRDAVAQFGSPLFIVDEVDVRARARNFLDAYRSACGANVFYAGKAFLTTTIARWVTEEGLGIDVASGGELAVALRGGVAGDRLIVGINSDASVRRLKGRNRPINPDHERAALVASFTMVDACVIFSEDTPMKLIKHIDPDVLVKGGDYKLSDIVGGDYVKSKGGKVLRCPFVEGKSTTGILKVVR